MRTSDRVQKWVGRCLMAGALVVTPAAAFEAGTLTYHAQMRAVDAAKGTHAVEARLVRGTADALEIGRVDTPVRWTEADGTVRTATVLAGVGRPANARVRVWVKGASATTKEPRTAARATSSAWLTALLTGAVVPFLAWGVRHCFALLANRRRYAQWEAEWAVKEPAMSGRRQD
ncbi:hypothetical protein ACH427_15645 [Streptomyces sp. NPDC020379]|uniref:Rv1733c family protein n=1 Tax=Streptomyces sp. NPDC020379 TaxID=3365071 RepID=UPI0037B3024B